MSLDMIVFHFNTNTPTERIAYIHLLQLISKLERTVERDEKLLQLDSRENTAAWQT
jgi:hypothetical protein